MRKSWRDGKNPQAPKKLTDSSPSVPQSSGPRSSMANLFGDELEVFIKECCSRWTGDDKITKFQEYYTSHPCKESLNEDIATKFHTTFSDVYDRMQEKDESLFEEFSTTDVIVTYTVQDKWKNASSETKDFVWTSLNKLAQLAGMYSVYGVCPPDMMNAISGMAGDIMEQLENGSMEGKDLNPMVMGQMMMEKIKPEDIASFGQSIMSGKNINSVLAMMKGSLSSGPLSQPMPGMPDLSSLMSNLEELTKKKE